MPGSRARWVNETQSGADRERRGLKYGNYPRDANTDPHLAEHDLNNLWDWVREDWGWNEDLANAVMWLDPNATDHRGMSRTRIDATLEEQPHLYRAQLPKWDAHIRRLREGFHPNCEGPTPQTRNKKSTFFAESLGFIKKLGRAETFSLRNHNLRVVKCLKV